VPDWQNAMHTEMAIKQLCVMSFYKSMIYLAFLVTWFIYYAQTLLC